MKIFAISLFLATYVLLLAFPKIRAYIALSSAAIFVTVFTIFGEISANEIFGYIFGSVDWNVIMMIAGTMGVVFLFIESKMPSLLADLIIEKMPNVKWAIISLSIFACLISAFVDNVATVLMVAPVALTISKKLKISPVPSIIAIAIASNLQGAATLVGDTTSILLGGYANLNFLDFFFYQGKPGLFWVVQAGALASTLVLMWVFRKDTQEVDVKDRTKVKNYFPTVLLLSVIAFLIIASFIENKPAETNGYICMALFIFGVIVEFIKTKDKTLFSRSVQEIDFTTILLLAGLFIVISSITKVGIVDDISNIFVNASGGNIFIIYTLLVWASVIFSAFIDNIPYIATMLPVTQGIAANLGVEPALLYFGLLVGATLGGNLTPIGASANITALGILRKDGHEVKAGQFMKISVPFTLAAVTTGYILVWVIFMPR